MTSVILLMAGVGSRMRANKNKMLIMLNNKPLYEYSLDLFKNLNVELILVVSKDDYNFFESLNLNVKLVIGGNTRQESVYNGLLVSSKDRVLIHDGARILASRELINKCLNSKAPSYFVGIKPKNTIRYDKSFKTLNRDELIEVQTPQGGNKNLFLNNFKRIIENNIAITDDISSLDEESLKETEFIQGEESNIKITTPFDLLIAKAILEDYND